MQTRCRLTFAVAGVLIFACASPALAQKAETPAQPTGSIEFTARVQPTGARPEPVRLLTFYLLRKSFAEIRAEAEKAEPSPNLEKFVDGLNFSPELKAWMKRTKVTDFNGTEFMGAVKTDDILNVPEFFEAYMSRNAGDTSVGFPSSKAKDADRVKNPQKYEKDQKDYLEAIRAFINKNPFTKDGIEVPLADINPAQRWVEKKMDYKKRIRARALELAELEYTVTKADTDVEGRGSFANIPVGDYWISSLEGEGIAGDVRLRWDTPVPVRAGRVTRAILSNVNAVREK